MIFVILGIFVVFLAVALGIAITAWSAPFTRKTSAILSIGPITGMPSIFVPIKFLSSSRNAETVPKTFFFAMSFAIICPAKPAPIIYSLPSILFIFPSDNLAVYHIVLISSMLAF